MPTAQAPEILAGSEHRETATLGMWVFLATELMFFGPLFFGYLHGRIVQPQAFVEASHHTHLWLGTLNTAILLTSSFFMALAVQSKSKALLTLTALLGIAFLCIKGFEYRSEMSEPASLFLYLYFAMTGLHAIHLAIGIGLVAWASRRLQVVEYVGLYWHFVDAIWIFLYPMFYLLERWH
jgi:cytochrome c oxidase subunit 3